MLVAAAAVAAFEAVGSILVVALLVCPAAALRLMTDRYNTQVLGGAAVGAGLGAVGYALAGPVPALFGSTIALNAAGVIGALAGLLVAVAGLLYGVRPRRRGSAAPGSAPAAG
jgi:manganese/zinc/iron transport system permease protein